ncbi:hypothetical protein BKA93DRAFT_829960 [Sparassis latifolia]
MTEEDASDDEDAEDLLGTKHSLSTTAQKARNDLQNRVTVKFRGICGIQTGQNWPGPTDTERFNSTTNERYWTPNFTKDVRYPENKELLEHVATLVKNDVTNSDNALKVLKQCRKYKWNHDTLVELAKTSFRSFKTIYQTQVDANKKKTHERNQRTNRHKHRREEKAKSRLTTVHTYKEKYGIDPTDLCHEAHMSDEASGPDPDDESTLSKIEWKREMAKKQNMDGDRMGVSELEKLKFCKVVRPGWRSDELSNVLKELDVMAWQDKPAKLKECVVIISVRNTGRTSDVPPLVAPFDFGINHMWWERNKNNEKFADVLTDWYTHGDLHGFGSAVGDCATNNEIDDSDGNGRDKGVDDGELVDEENEEVETV